MQITFEGFNQLDENFYKKLMFHYILTTFGREDIKNLKNANIIVKPSTMAEFDPFFHGQNGTGGVTGINYVRLYLFDVGINSFVNQSNTMTVSHELAHLALLMRGRQERYKLKFNDFSGNRAGKELAFYVGYVHDAHTNGQVYIKMISKVKNGKLIKLPASVLDVREMLQ